MKMHCSFVHKKISQLSVPDFFKDSEPNCLVPGDPKLLLQLTHLLSVSYFSASQGVFLRPWTGLLSIHGPVISWSPTGDPQQSCHGQCTEQGPLGYLPNSGTKHADKCFQHCSSAEAGPNADWDNYSSRGRPCVPRPDRNVEFSSIWFGFLKADIFYKKIQFYCIVNMTWQLQVKVSSLIALNETKSSQIHAYTHGEKIHHVLLELWENSTGIMSGLETLPEDAVCALIQNLLLQSMFSLQLWFCSWRTQAQAILRYFALLLKCLALLLFVCRQLGCPHWFSKVI